MECISVRKGSIAEPPPGKRVTKISFVYDENGNISQIQFYMDSQLLFILYLRYDASGNLVGISREEVG